jgi:hypothetical protein
VTYLKDILKAHADEYYRTGDKFVKSRGIFRGYEFEVIKSHQCRVKRQRKMYGRTLRVITKLNALDYRRLRGERL